jgi:adenylate kinase
MKSIISIYGLPACGKTTQAEKLSKAFGLYQFGMGDRLRAEIQSGSQLGQKIQGMVDKGILIPDEDMILVVGNCDQQAKETGIIFDGFPRMINQAKMLDEILAKSNLAVDKFFYLKISQEEAVKRINERSLITGRIDDKDLDAVKNRIGIFNEQSVILIDYYRQQGKLVEIDGEQSIEEVYSEICKNL